MATDYSKKTNAELVEILKSRNLTHTGKKAELVARIQEDDTKNNGGEPAPAAPAAKTDVADDVIDWEDDDVPVEGTTKPSTEAGAAAIAAGGKGQVSNPAAVPNQKLDTDPAATDDLKVEAAGGEAGKDAAPEQETEGAAAPAGEEGAPDAAQEEKPAPNFAKGLPITELEEELRKRKARAEKFGITEDSQAAIAQAEQNIERAKRFGTGADANASVGVKGLDEALPQEKTRKRGRNEEQGGRGGKRRNFGGRGGNRPRRGGQGGQGGNRNKTSNGSGEKPQPAQMSEQDRAALEARKKRFAAAS